MSSIIRGSDNIDSAVIVETNGSAVTDNAIVRYDGTTGKVQNSPITIDDKGNIGSGTQSFNGLGGSGFKNYIINGGFDVCQRSISLTDGYQFDRWIINGSAQLSSLFMGNLNGETVNNKALFFTKSGSGTTYFQQRIEFPRRLAGKTITVSFKAYSNITMAGVVYFDKYNPTDGYSNLIAGQTFNWSQSWNKIALTFTLPSLGTNYDANDAFITLVINSAGTTSGAYLGEVQLEEGSIATPFEQRPYGLELSLCQRYYEKVDCTNWAYSPSATIGIAGFLVKFNIHKRVVPTLSTFTMTSSNGSNTYSIDSATASMCRVVCNSTGTGVCGVTGNFIASAEL